MNAFLFHPRLHLLTALFLLAFAPLSDILHWQLRSDFFAKFGFIVLVAVVMQEAVSASISGASRKKFFRLINKLKLGDLQWLDMF